MELLQAVVREQVIEMEDPEVFEDKFDEWAVDTRDDTEMEGFEMRYKHQIEKAKEIFDKQDRDTEILERDPYCKKWLFENGYGLSVIRKYGSYGFEKGKFEIGVIESGDRLKIEDTILTYDTPITDDVIGHLESEEVKEIGERVKHISLNIDEDETGHEELDEAFKLFSKAETKLAQAWAEKHKMEE